MNKVIEAGRYPFTEEGLAMRWFLTILAGLLVVACAWGAGPPGGDPKGLQGYWVLESLEINGQTIEIDALKIDEKPLAPRLTVKGERYTLYLADKPYAMLYRVELEYSPRRITLTILEAPNKGKAFHGIYKIEGDRFTICRPLDPDRPRPKVFATAPNSGLIMGTWKCVKP
jgi:uncharacterized protein (TIGR03067 family)